MERHNENRSYEPRIYVPPNEEELKEAIQKGEETLGEDKVRTPNSPRKSPRPHQHRKTLTGAANIGRGAAMNGNFENIPLKQGTQSPRGHQESTISDAVSAAPSKYRRAMEARE